MKYVTRKEWGALPPKSVTRLRRTVSELVYHYSAANADEQSDHKNCAARVRGIQRFHMGPARGWNDIAYNFLTCKHGYVFEGRGFDVRSAATGPANDYTLASCFLGDDTKGRDDVTNPGRQAMLDIARAVVERHTAGRHRIVFGGHRDHMQTTCPGDEIHAYVTSPRFAKLAHREAEVKLWPVPVPSWFWAWAEWRLSGRRGPRPAVAPAKVPDWAWRRLQALHQGRGQ